MSPTAKPPSARWMLAVGILGVVGGVYGFVLLAIITETYVWEGWHKFTDLGDTYMLFWFSFTALMTVARDVKRSAYGSSERPLSPNDENAIRQAVVRGDRIAAIRLYRNLAGASLAEALHFVEGVTREVEAEHPGVIAANIRAQYRVRPKRLLVGLLIEAAILAATVSVLAAPDRVRSIFEVMGSGLAGFAFVLAFKRFSGLWRFAISISASLILMAAEATNGFLLPEATFGVFFVGFFAGIVLFRIAYARGPAGQAATVSGWEGSSN